jgi:hypothetical protein
MIDATVERRIAELESRVDTLQRVVGDSLTAQTSKKRGWRAIVGTFSNDPLYEEAMRLGREWRESQFVDNQDPT